MGGEWLARYAADEERRMAEARPVTEEQMRAIAELLVDDPYNARVARRILRRKRSAR